MITNSKIINVVVPSMTVDLAYIACCILDYKIVTDGLTYWTSLEVFTDLCPVPVNNINYIRGRI